MIHVENLYHSYDHNTTYAVKDINFHIQSGEVFGFLGPSGAGKSTTQNILTGLLPLQQGNVTVNNYDIRQVNKKRFNAIGVSFEQSNIYSKLTALENLQYYAKLFDKPTRDPIELIKSVGLDQSLNKKAGTFSKGMKHRLTFARSLINNPQLWFLDEPTTGLDPAIAANIKNIIKQENQRGVTCFLTTHNMHIADELCNRVAFIVNGQLMLIDSPKNLKLTYGQKSVEVEYLDDGEPTNQCFRLNHPKDRQALKEIVDHHDIITMHSKEASLEQIFIEVTGQHLA